MTPEDFRGGRLIQFDERSRKYPVRLSGAPVIKSKSWAIARRLDQGNSSACTGFSLAHTLLSARRRNSKVTEADAFALYEEARKFDEWDGDDYEGSSVLGALKAAKANGRIKGYRWNFGLMDTLHALSVEGPVSVGTYIYEGMLEPGLVSLSGRKLGGHAYCLGCIDTRKDLVTIRQSWGIGDQLIRFADLEKLLIDSGESALVDKL